MDAGNVSAFAVATAAAAIEAPGCLPAFDHAKDVRVVLMPTAIGFGAAQEG
ncbi:MAG: hypothetical protein NT090_17975 [Acidobacteria bacterium]|nr:hypothetical protein [Acidobacteriota bacterium]